MLLADMISVSQMAAIITDPKLPDNPIVACNAAFVALTGYAQDEIVGRNCRFLAGAATDPEATQQIRDAVREVRPALVELLNYKKDGTAFRNAVMIAPIFDAEGKVEYFLGSQMDVGESVAEEYGRRAGAQRRVDALTPRQREVLIAMAAGKPNKEIAHELTLTERTVKMHRAAMFHALEVKSGAEAIRIAFEAGY